jgi:hypothetical protein
VAKWTGLGLCVAVLLVWGLSLFVGAGTPIGERGFIGVTGGRLYFGAVDSYRTTMPRARIGVSAWLGAGFAWPEVLRLPQNNLLRIAIPLWLLIAIGVVLTAALFHLDRRRIGPGLCTECGYDLTDNTSGICSECGTKVRVTP